MKLQKNYLPRDKDKHKSSWGYNEETEKVVPLKVDSKWRQKSIASDEAWRVWMNTVFWDQITWRRVPTLSSQFHYPLETWRSIFAWANWGSVNNNDSQLRLVTDTQADSLAIITWTFYLRYIPGHEAYSLFTMVFNEPTSADSYQRIGIFDWDNWFYIWYNWTDFVLWRVRNWTRSEIIVDTTKVFPSTLFSAFNPQKWNIYRISFAYLGFGPITYEVMLPNGWWVVLWQVQYPNNFTETNTATSYLPIRGELFNWSSAEVMEMSSWSVTTWIVDGAWVDPWARRFAFSSWSITIIAWNQTLVIFRNKSTYATKENRVNSILTLVSAATEWIKTVSWRVVRNPTITIPWTWVDVETADSIMEYNVTWVVDPASWKDLLGWNMAKSDSFFQQLNDQKITLAPGEWAWIIVNSVNASDVSLSFRWEELF